MNATPIFHQKGYDSMNTILKYNTFIIIILSFFSSLYAYSFERFEIYQKVNVQKFSKMMRSLLKNV